MGGRHLFVAFVAAGLVVASATGAGSASAGRAALNRIAGPTTTTTTTQATTTTTSPPTTTTTTAPPPPTTTVARWRAGSVALTFDDGPSDQFTPQVLDILARYGVKATFFLVGAEAEARPALVERIVNEGHVVGNHTWDHVALSTLDDDGFIAQIDRTEELLRRLSGQRVECVRPPFGKIDARSRAAVRARGLRVEMWSADSGDWRRPGTDAIVTTLLARAEPGAVMLLHDSGPDMSETVAALPALIEGIRARGLSLAPIC